MSTRVVGLTTGKGSATNVGRGSGTVPCTGDSGHPRGEMGPWSRGEASHSPSGPGTRTRAVCAKLGGAQPRGQDSAVQLEQPVTDPLTVHTTTVQEVIQEPT